MSRFIDPTTDFGFKKIFGKEANKEIIMDFIAAVLELPAPLLDITFKDKEQLPEGDEERSGIYDIYCQDVAGNHFIVEMQKNRIPFVTDRMIYYATFPIAAQAQKGRKPVIYREPTFEPMMVREVATIPYGNKAKVAAKAWDFRLSDVYCIAVLCYAFDDSATAVNRSRIRNDQLPHASFSDKVQFVTLELPLFDERRPEYSLDRRINKWLFFLRYLSELKRMPNIFKGDEIFERAFEIAEYASLSPKEKRRYHLSLKRLRDTYAVFEAKYDEGFGKGEINAGQKLLLSFFSKKLGPAPSAIADGIRALNDLKRIDAIMTQHAAINEWQELQKFLPPLEKENKV